MRTQPSLDGAITVRTHVPVADTAAVITIAAVEGETHVIDEIEFSYDVVPGAVKVFTIASGGVTLWSTSLANVAIIRSHTFQRGLPGTKSANMVITLPAGTGTCLGKVNALTR